jgi:hypothetical protein
VHLNRDAPEARRLHELIALYKDKATRKLVDTSISDERLIQIGKVRAFEQIIGVFNTGPMSYEKFKQGA